MGKKAIAEWLVETYAVSKRRACRLIQLYWSSCNYQPVKKKERALIMRIRDLAAARVRNGYRRITVLLKREGWSVGKKRIYRIYKGEGLEVRTKKRKKRAAQRRVSLPAATAAQERWSMDFMCTSYDLILQVTLSGSIKCQLAIGSSLSWLSSSTFCVQSTLSSRKVCMGVRPQHILPW